MHLMDFNKDIKSLCNNIKENSVVNPSLYEKYNVKRGLRNSDGTGVVAGITNICNVHGYVLNEGEVEPIPGQLIYRGYNVNDLVENVEEEDRYGFEETVFLLIFGHLPNKRGIKNFLHIYFLMRDLPNGFVEDMILKAPSKNIMNKLARSVLALYSYDDECETKGLEYEMKTAVSLISKLPVIMSNAYQVKRRSFDNESMIMHPIRYEENTAQCILSLLRLTDSIPKMRHRCLTDCSCSMPNTAEETIQLLPAVCLHHREQTRIQHILPQYVRLKDLATVVQTFKVIHMLDNFKANIKHWENEGEVADYMRKTIRKEANDRSGLIYGMGHAVYTISDPRAVILKKKAFELAAGKEIEAEFKLLETIERLTPEIFKEVKGSEKTMCANVDMYSGLVYRMLGIPEELFTPLFAVARMAGWSAHRMEEILTSNRIIRPAYKAIAKEREYVKLEDRE